MNKGKDVTHWGSALTFLAKLGLNLETDSNDCAYFTIANQITGSMETTPQFSATIKGYFTTINRDKYLDWHKTNRDAFENIALIAKCQLVGYQVSLPHALEHVI